MANTIAKDNVIVPEIYSKPYAADEATYAAHASANMTWKNAPQDDGIRAYDQSDRLMRWKNGKPIEIKFSNSGAWKTAAGLEARPAPKAAPSTTTVPNPFNGAARAPAHPTSSLSPFFEGSQIPEVQ